MSGNVAVIGVTGFEIFLGADFPVGGQIRVTDGGGPDSGPDTFEFATRSGTNPGDPPIPGPTDCSSFPAGEPILVNRAGDLTVIDAPPLPTSKDQCKHGGWRNLSQFKNQGQCIAFVNHQGRQACLAERVTIGRAAFRGKCGKGPQHRHALRRCIRRTTRG